MKKIRKAVKAIVSAIKNPWLLNTILSDDAEWKKYIEKKYKIKNLPLVEINDLIPCFSETVELAFLDGSSLPTDMALLKALCKKFERCNYFEIGTWRGESAMNVSTIADKCVTFDLSKEELRKRKITEEEIKLHSFFSKDKKNILHLHGNTFKYDFSELNEKFDVLFIDGDHHYEYVKNDTEKVFRNLIHEKSMVVWHDYAHSPETIRYEVLAGILDGIPEQFRNNLYHVSNTLCAIFIRENIISKEFHSPAKPDKKFAIKIETKKLN
ncbi:MAG: class I SAM-dependent methyltransferase [Bacteroidetes bacterium]|nr:class I SAM-dependent methyltransferase [Bacteroidota bacterium]